MKILIFASILILFLASCELQVEEQIPEEPIISDRDDKEPKEPEVIEEKDMAKKEDITGKEAEEEIEQEAVEPVEEEKEIEVIGIAPSIELEDYPDAFLKGDEFDAVVVVGADGTSDDVIGGTEILTKLTLEGYEVDSPLLDSEVEELSEVNSILIGNACTNKMIAKVIGNEECTLDLREGESKIMIYGVGNGNHAIIVTGFNRTDVKKAAFALADYKESDLSGTSVIV